MPYVYDMYGNKIHAGDKIKATMPYWDFSGSDMPLLNAGEIVTVEGITIDGRIRIKETRSYYDVFEPHEFLKV